jgi:chromosome segregation ATPase
VYVAKRKELQELELKYRKKQDVNVEICGRYKAKIEANDEIIRFLLGQMYAIQQQILA